jgi:hypothetical protein
VRSVLSPTVYGTGTALACSPSHDRHRGSPDPTNVQVKIALNQNSDVFHVTCDMDRVGLMVRPHPGKVRPCLEVRRPGATEE